MLRRLPLFPSVGAAVLVLASPLAAQEKDWQEIARSDVEAAFAIYRDNHPGWNDPDNPGFRSQLEKARSLALLAAASANSRDDYAAALAAFNAELSDGHAHLGVVWPEDTEAPEPLWPGFVLAWRGQQAVVHHAEPGSGWVRGSIMLSCDERPFTSFARDRITRTGGRPAEDGHWWSRMPLLFAGAETDIPARTCTAMEPDGRVASRTLAWEQPPANFATLRRDAAAGIPLAIGLTQPAKRVHWIALPTFAPDAEGRAAYEKLFADMGGARDSLRAAEAVVIDLRGNQGGSSSWSRQVAQRLWGENAVAGRMADYFRHVSIWWRATEENRAYLESLEEIVADQPATLDFVRQAEKGVAEAVAAGETYWIEPADEDDGASVPAPATTDFTAPVYVIVPGNCASACLDAIDTFTRFANTSLIGAPSAGDTTYMEVRRDELPSGEGTIVVPLKVWRGRPRPAGFIYHPRIRVDALDWTQEVFLETIAKDTGGL